MAHENPGGIITKAVAGPIKRFRRVKLDGSGKLVTATSTDRELGTLEHEAFADGEERSVRLRNVPGTRRFVAAGAVAVGADVFTADAGKVNDTNPTGSYRVGIAMTATAADGDLITVATDPGSEPKAA